LVVPYDSSPTTVRVSRSGRFAYALRATPGSTGTVRLRSTRKVRVGSRKRFVQVPATRFIAGATGGATVTLKLSSASLRTLERLKKLRFTVSVVVGGGSFTATLTLRAPKTR
jgi:hypothetical protein